MDASKANELNWIHLFIWAYWSYPRSMLAYHSLFFFLLVLIQNFCFKLVFFCFGKYGLCNTNPSSWNQTQVSFLSVSGLTYFIRMARKQCELYRKERPRPDATCRSEPFFVLFQFDWETRDRSVNLLFICTPERNLEREENVFQWHFAEIYHCHWLTQKKTNRPF